MATADLEPLILDMIEWLRNKPRSYADVMDAWRTSCPRLTVWEDAIERGLVTRGRDADQTDRVVVTQAGARFLQDSGRSVRI
ncbi:MAG: hypothetical protein ACRCWF_14130 [Beijerinckiaceae bacterium]